MTRKEILLFALCMECYNNGKNPTGIIHECGIGSYYNQVLNLMGKITLRDKIFKLQCEVDFLRRNYLDNKESYLEMTPEELLKEFNKDLKDIIRLTK